MYIGDTIIAITNSPKTNPPHKGIILNIGILDDDTETYWAVLYKNKKNMPYGESIGGFSSCRNVRLVLIEKTLIPFDRNTLVLD